MPASPIVMQIQRNEQDAIRRVVYIVLYKTSSPYNLYTSSLTTKTVQITKNHGTPGASTNYIAAVDTTNAPGFYYIQLEKDEVDELGMLLIAAKIGGTSVEGVAFAQIVEFDPYTEGASTAMAIRQRAGQPR